MLLFRVGLPLLDEVHDPYLIYNNFIHISNYIQFYLINDMNKSLIWSEEAKGRASIKITQLRLLFQLLQLLWTTISKFFCQVHHLHQRHANVLVQHVGFVARGALSQLCVSFTKRISIIAHSLAQDVPRVAL